MRTPMNPQAGAADAVSQPKTKSSRRASSDRPSSTVAINALANSLRSLVALCVLFLLTPYVIRELGAEQYGLWVVLASVIGYFELLDCGLATATVKFIGQFEGQRRPGRRNRLASTLFVAYLIIAAIVLAFATLLSTVLVSWLSVAPQFASIALAVFAILTAKAALNLPLTLFVGILFGRQRILPISVARACFHIVYGLAAWQALSRGGGLVGFACVHALLSVLEHLVLMAICYLATPKLRIAWRLFDPTLLREVFGFSVFSLMTNLSSTALLRTDPILIKMFLPLWMVAVYGVALKIAEQLLMVAKQGLNAVTPLIAQLHGASSRQGIRSVLLQSTKWSLAAMLTLAVPVGCWARETLTLWVGPQFAGGGAVVTLLAGAMVLRIVQEASANVLGMTGRHRLVAIVAAVNAIANVALSLLLLSVWGAGGVALATVVTTGIGMIWTVQQACREHNIPLADYWREGIGPAVRAGMLPVFVCLLLQRMVAPQQWLSLILVHALGAGSMALGFLVFGLNPEERRILASHTLPRWLQLTPSTASLQRNGERP